MVIKISAFIYTLASIAFITLMIVRPAVEIEVQPVQNTITVNTDSRTTNTEVDSTPTPIATATNPSLGDDPLNTAPTVTEGMIVTPTPTSETPTTMPLQNDTYTIAPTVSENSTNIPTNNTSSTVSTTAPIGAPATTPATAAPTSIVVPPAPSNPVTTTPIQNPITAPNVTPTEVLPVSPQSHSGNTESQTVAAIQSTTAIATPLQAVPVSEEKLTFPNSGLTTNTIPNQALPAVDSVQPIATSAATSAGLNMPSNVINTPLVDVLADDVKKNMQ